MDADVATPKCEIERGTRPHTQWDRWPGRGKDHPAACLWQHIQIACPCRIQITRSSQHQSHQVRRPEATVSRWRSSSSERRTSMARDRSCGGGEGEGEVFFQGRRHARATTGDDARIERVYAIPDAIRAILAHHTYHLTFPRFSSPFCEPISTAVPTASESMAPAPGRDSSDHIPGAQGGPIKATRAIKT